MIRVPVVNPDGSPAMPCKSSRARKMVRDGKAVGKFNKLGIYYIQLLDEPSGREKQDISVGLDPGKRYSGIGLVSKRFTLFTAHLFLPFETVKKRMEQRRMMRQSLERFAVAKQRRRTPVRRRGRRINRKVEFSQRAHRQKRFSNRRQKKVVPSIKSNRLLEIRVITELAKIYPISSIVYEYVKAKTVKGCSFSPVQVGQKWAIKQLSKIAPVITKFGWQTSNLRKYLGLEKQKTNKKEAIPATHATDGVTLAASQFTDYLPFENSQGHGHCWQGKVVITDAPFFVIRRPPVSRRQHGANAPSSCLRMTLPALQAVLMIPVKGGLRRKYGGTTTRHDFRKGDFVEGVKAGITYQGWCSGDTAKQVSISNAAWKRVGQFTKSKVRLLRRATGLICTQEKKFLVAV